VLHAWKLLWRRGVAEVCVVDDSVDVEPVENLTLMLHQ
jgi:hypothetical protein